MLGCRQRSSHGRPGLGFQQPPQPVCSVSSVGCRTLANEEGSCDPLDRMPRGGNRESCDDRARVRGSDKYGRCGGRVGPRGRLRGTVPCV